MPGGNCDVYSYVDFGEGLVRIRCTNTGSHRDHECRVRIIMGNEDDANDEFDEASLQHRNVFKRPL